MGEGKETKRGGKEKRCGAPRPPYNAEGAVFVPSALLLLPRRAFAPKPLQSEASQVARGRVNCSFLRILKAQWSIRRPPEHFVNSRSKTAVDAQWTQTRWRPHNVFCIIYSYRFHLLLVKYYLRILFSKRPVRFTHFLSVFFHNTYIESSV